MKKDCKTIECKSVKNSLLFTVGSTPYSIAEAQAVLDAYVDEGYTLFDASTNHTLDVSGEAGDKILIVWQDANPFVGEYQLRASYFAGKTVVILAVKLDGSDDVEAVGLRVNFNSFEAGQQDLNALTFEGTDEFYFYRQYGAFNLTGVSFRKCECHWHRKATLEITDLDRVKFWSRDSVDITTTQTLAVFDMEKETGWANGTEQTVTISGSYGLTSFVKVGKYIYASYKTSLVTGHVHKIDIDTMTAVASVETSYPTGYLATDGKTIYVAGSEARYVKKINVVDFTLDVGTIDLGAGVVGGPGTCSGLFALFANGTKIYKITISSGAVSSANAEADPVSIVTNGNYAGVGMGGGGLRTDVHIVTLSDLTVRTVEEDTRILIGLVMDETYVYTHDSVVPTVIKIAISNLAVTLLSTATFLHKVKSEFGEDLLLANLSTGDDSGKIFERYAMADGAILEIINLGFEFLAPVWYDGLFMYLINGAKVEKITYLYGADSVSSALNTIMNPDPAIVLADDYLTMTLSKLRLRYYTPPESSIDAVRMYYMTEFDALAEVDDRLKKFSGGRTLVVNRPDISAVLAASSTEKVIISGVMYDHDGTTPYDYTGLPADENFFILAQDSNGNYAYFMWYNEEIVNTYFSNIKDGVTYTVKACFQLWKRRSSEIDLVNMKNGTNAPLEGTIEWNNIDNEYIIK